MRYTFFLLTLAALASGQTPAPSITSITNAALPTMDAHVPTRLKPRSIATIFGSNLATSTASIAPPWPTTLGGAEVHLIPLFTGCGTANPPAGLSCELIADLIYVSNSQINFLVPDVLPTAYGQTELSVDIVLIRDGLRFDSLVSFAVDSAGDFAVFQVGFDCDFSLSLAYPAACGYSQFPGNNRVAIGAVTDIIGHLVTSQNPVHQGEGIILWATGVGALTVNPTSGLLQRNSPTPIKFGVLQPQQNGGYSVFNLSWRSEMPIWAGESPQFVGLDQLNLVFPTCSGPAATFEQRYDLVLTFQSPSADKNLGIGSASLYVPFIISPNEPTCQFGA